MKGNGLITLTYYRYLYECNPRGLLQNLITEEYIISSIVNTLVNKVVIRKLVVIRKKYVCNPFDCENPV